MARTYKEWLQEARATKAIAAGMPAEEAVATFIPPEPAPVAKLPKVAAPPPVKSEKKAARPPAPKVTGAAAAVKPVVEEKPTAPANYGLPPEAMREIDYRKFYDAAATPFYSTAIRFAAEDMETTPESLEDIAQQQGVSLREVFDAKLKGRTYDQIAEMGRQRGVLGFMPVNERASVFQESVKRLDDATKGIASDEIYVKPAKESTSYAVAGTHTQLPEVSKPGEHGYEIAKILVDALKNDKEQSRIYDLYGRSTTTGNTQKYVEERTQQLAKRAGITVTTPDALTKMAKLRKRALNEILAYKTIGLWTPAVVMQLPEVTEETQAPGFFDALAPNIELIGINNKGQAIFRQESGLGVALRAIDIPQEAVTGWLTGEGAARGVQTGANLMEYTFDATEDWSPWARTPTRFLGGAAAIAFPDMLLAGGLVGKAAKAGAKSAKITLRAPEVVRLLEEASTARNARDFATANRAESKIRELLPVVGDALDQYDSSTAQVAILRNPADDIANEDLASVIAANIPTEDAHELAASRSWLHPSIRAEKLSVKSRGKVLELLASDEAYNTQRLLDRVEASKQSYLRTMPDTVDGYAKMYTKGTAKDILTNLPDSVLEMVESGARPRLSVEDLDEIGRIVDNAAPQALTDFQKFTKTVETALEKHKKFGKPEYFEYRQLLRSPGKNSFVGRVNRKMKEIAGKTIEELKEPDLALFERAKTSIEKNNEIRAVAADLLREKLAADRKITIRPSKLFDDIAPVGPDGKPVKLSEGALQFIAVARKLDPNTNLSHLYAVAALVDKPIQKIAKKIGRDPYTVWAERAPRLMRASEDEVRRFGGKIAAGPATPPPAAPPSAGAPPPPAAPPAIPPAPALPAPTPAAAAAAAATTPPSVAAAAAKTPGRAALQWTPPIPAGTPVRDITDLNEAKELLRAAKNNELPTGTASATFAHPDGSVSASVIVVGDVRIVWGSAQEGEKANVVVRVGGTSKSFTDLKDAKAALDKGMNTAYKWMGGRAKDGKPIINNVPDYEALKPAAAVTEAPVPVPAPVAAKPAPLPAPVPTPAVSPTAAPKKLSISVLQREGKLGYNRAAELMDRVRKGELTEAQAIEEARRLGAEPVAAAPTPAIAEPPTPAPIAAAVEAPVEAEKIAEAAPKAEPVVEAAPKAEAVVEAAPKAEAPAVRVAEADIDKAAEVKQAAKARKVAANKLKLAMGKQVDAQDMLDGAPTPAARAKATKTLRKTWQELEAAEKADEAAEIEYQAARNKAEARLAEEAGKQRPLFPELKPAPPVAPKTEPVVEATPAPAVDVERIDDAVFETDPPVVQPIENPTEIAADLVRKIKVEKSYGNTTGRRFTRVVFPDGRTRDILVRGPSDGSAPNAWGQLYPTTVTSVPKVRLKAAEIDAKQLAETLDDAAERAAEQALAKLDEQRDFAKAIEDGETVIDGQLTSDMDRVIAHLGANMYNKPLAEVTVKELIQNAFDAVKGAVASGQIERGNIVLKIIPETRSLEVIDNGVGMSTETVQNGIFRIAGSAKPNLTQAQQSGGLGLAKMAFLFGSKEIELRTVKDGIETYVRTNPAEIRTNNFKIIRRKAAPDTPNGTTMRVAIPEAYLDPNRGEQVKIYFSPYGSSYGFVGRPLIGPTNLTIVDAVGSTAKATDVPEGMTKLTSAKFDWGSADIYVSADRPRFPNHQILSAGLFQFDTTFSSNGQAFPYHVVVDVHSDVDTTHPHYPFTNQREAFRGSVEADVKALTAYLMNYTRGIDAETTADRFKTAVQMKRVDLNEVGGDINSARADILKRFSAEAEKTRALPAPPPPPAQIVIKAGEARDAETGKVVAKQADLQAPKASERQAKASFQADKKLTGGQEFINSQTIDPKVPLFHNNTNVDYIQAARDAGHDPEAFFTLLGSVVVEFRERAAKRRGYEVLENAYASGVSIDKEYKGVHVRVPYLAFFVNPLAHGGETPVGAAESMLHTLIHEAVHTKVNGHDENFTIELGRLYEQLADTADVQAFRTALEKTLSQHWDTFLFLRSNYERYTTTNLARSMGSESGAASSLARGGDRALAGESLGLAEAGRSARGGNVGAGSLGDAESAAREASGAGADSTRRVVLAAVSEGNAPTPEQAAEFAKLTQVRIDRLERSLIDRYGPSALDTFVLDPSALRGSKVAASPDGMLAADEAADLRRLYAERSGYQQRAAAEEPDVLKSISPRREAQLAERTAAKQKRQVDVLVARLAGENIAAEFENIPEVFRVNARSRLARVNKALAAGTINEAEHGKIVQGIVDSLEEQKRLRQAAAARDKVRGPYEVRRRLLQAAQQGTLDERGVDLADWFIQQNPRMADELGVSIRGAKAAEAEGGVRGFYSAMDQIVTVLDNSDELTATHEILHHTERMLSTDLQAAVRKEWTKRVTAAMKGADTETRALLEDALTGTNIKGLEDAVRAGNLSYELVSPSEFWAVNASKIVSGRYAAFNKGLAAKAKQWLTEFVQKVKSVFGFQSDAPLIRGLDAVLKGDGTFVSERLLSSRVRAPSMQAPTPSGNLGAAARQIETPEFKRWFGDSKVVDAEGKPLVVYHGTPETGLTVLDPRRSMEVDGAVFFTNSDDVADQYRYAREYGEIVGDEAGDLVKAYLRMKNPLVVDFEGKVGSQPEVSRVIRQAKAEGYDGVIIKNVDDSVDSSGLTGTTYAVFEPTQIKSATANVGTFSPEDPNILKSISPPGGGKPPTGAGGVAGGPPPPSGAPVVVRLFTPSGEVQGIVETMATGQDAIKLFENADLSTVIRGVGVSMRRMALDMDEMSRITNWLRSLGIQVSHRYGEFIGNADDVERAEVAFGQALERYVMEGTSANPEIEAALGQIKDSMVNLYKNVSDPVLGATLAPDVRNTFDRLLAEAGDVPKETVKSIIRRRMLGGEAENVEFLEMLALEAQRKGIPKSSVEDLQKQFDVVHARQIEDAKQLEKQYRAARKRTAPEDLDALQTRYEADKQRILSDDTIHIKFDGPVFGKSDWSLDDLARAQAQIDMGRSVERARARGLQINLRAETRKTGALVEEETAVEKLRSALVARDTDGVITEKGKKVLRGVTATFFGGDVIGEKTARYFPPEMRKALNTVERVVEESIGDTITLVNDAIRTKNDRALIKYLSGSTEVRRLAGRPIVSAGHDYMGSVLGMVRRMIFNNMTDDERLALKELASIMNGPKEEISAGVAKFGFRAGPNNELSLSMVPEAAAREFTAADKIAAARGNHLRSAITKILFFRSGEEGASTGEALSKALREAVGAPPGEAARVWYEMRFVETLSYLGGLTAREGKVFTGTSENAARLLIGSEKLPGSVAHIYGDEAARRVAVLIGGYGSADLAKNQLVKLDLGLSPGARQAFESWAAGKAWDPVYAEDIQRIVDRYGYNPNLVEDAILDANIYIPREARERLAQALARSTYRSDQDISGARMINSLYRYMKTRMTRGSFFLRPRYYMMNTIDHFIQMSMTNGFAVAAKSTTRVVMQDLMVLPFWQQLVEQVSRLPLANRVIPPDILERFRSGLQKLGDRGAQAVGKLFAASKYRIEVNPILEGLEGGFRAGNKVYSYQEVRRIAVQEGVFASFDTRQLANAIEREGALVINEQLTGLTDLRQSTRTVSTAQGIPFMRNFFADWQKTVSDTAEAWGERERLGAMVTLMEAGYDPRTSARLVIDALYDYSQSMTKADRSLLVGIMFPFWAFQKNANQQIFNLMFSPWGAYRMMCIERARERGADLLAEITYNMVGGEYSLDVKSMPPELQDTYYSIVTAFERAYDGNPPAEAKRALRMILTNRARDVDFGKFVELSPELTRMRESGTFAEVANKFAPYVVLRPSKSERMTYLRDREGIPFPYPRTKIVQAYNKLLGDQHSYLEYYLPESTIESGMKHLTQVLAGYIMLGSVPVDWMERAAQGAGVYEGETLTDRGAEEAKVSRIVGGFFDPARSPFIGPILADMTVDYVPQKKIATKLAAGVEGVTKIHPLVGKLMDDAFGTTLLRVPEKTDPFVIGALNGDITNLTEEQIAEIKKLQEEYPDIGKLRDQRYYIQGGVWTHAFENSPLGELNALLLNWETSPAESADIRGKTLAWARAILGADVAEVSATKTMRAEEPTKLKETKGI